MKLWQLLSAFRDEVHTLNTVLTDPMWTEFNNYFVNIERIIAHQDRKTLDQEIPFVLAYAIAIKSKKTFWLSFAQSPQLLFAYKPDIENLEKISPAEILVRFGGDKIETAYESSYVEVMPRALNNEAELIESFKLTSIGLISIIRTKHEKLLPGSSLSNQDGNWIVLRENIHAYNAYTDDKLEAQKKQHIYGYILKGNIKPRPGSILKLNTQW